jgi:hypothetical protein
MDAKCHPRYALRPWVGFADPPDSDSGDFSSLARSMQLGLRLSRAFAFGAAGPWRRVDLAIAVDNLADQPIFDQAGLPQPGRTFRIQTRLW